ncbi:MAG: virulence plasmid 65kDa protein, partial [Proteobacteria bacterium]|nr:virulence plasmid 65kDa protein [Pseudomonadota bacterium]
RDQSPNVEEQDISILSGAEDLLPISDPTQSPTQYRLRTEGLFARIENR